MKNFTNNFKQFTSRLSARWFIMVLMLLVGTSSAWAAGGAGGPMGVYLGVNGNNTWYKINGVNSWNMTCSGYAFDNANALPSSLGNITSGLSLEGLGIIGWTDSNSDWVAGKINYTITPGSKSGSYEIGNFENPSWGNGGHVRCSSGNNRVTAVKSSINLIDGLGAGDYTLKFEYFARMQWQNNNGNGYYDDNNGNARGTKSATFTIPGYSTTTGDKDFGEVDVNSSSDYTVELTHYGSDNTATVSITGTNKSEFTATVTESGDNTQKLTVTFKPTSVAPDKTATIKVTDAYNKTYTLTVTGTGKQSCQAPTSVSVTGSETPCVGANETYTADIVGGSKYDLEWAVPDGYTIIEGQGTTSIIVEVGTTSGNITCTATCGNAAPSDEISVAPYTTVAPTINLSAEYVCPDESATITVESPELNVEGLSYKLYNKNDTSTPIAIITEPKTEPVAFTIQEGTYYVTVSHTCGGEKKSTNEKTLQEYQAPAMPAYTSTPATSCKETPNSDGTIALKNTIGYITYTLDEKEGDSNVWTRLSVGTHKLAATINTCPSLTKEWDVEVGVKDITPTATVSITGDVSFCEGGNTVLTSVVTATQGEVTAYQWYNGEEPIQGATASTYTANAAGNYKVVVTVKNKGCEDTFNATKEVSVKNKPTTPEFNPDFTSICVGGSTTLAGGYSWYTDLNASALVDLTVSPRTTTTYYATKVESGCTSDAGEFTVTVNPLPAITAISVNNSSPVINEDVLLTVEGGDIETVEWSITSGNNASLSDASGNSVKLTSTKSGAVTVTATAKSGAGCSATSTKEVTFSETEDCADVETTTTITTRKTKITYAATIPSGWSDIYCYAWNTSGDTPITNAWPGNKMVKDASNKYVIVLDIDQNVEFKVKFNQGNNDKQSTNDSEKYTGGFLYSASTITGKPVLSGSTAYTETTPTTTTTPAPLSAPAVKTVSATSEEGSGIVTFTGKIVKTGCAAKSSIYYGYQFKKADEEWPTSDIEASNTPEALKLIPCTNASATALNYQFSANVEGLENGNYHFRAYIINGYNFTNGNYDQGVYYGLDKLITVSTTKTPISNVTLNYCDKNGGNVGVDPNPMCKGATAYVKLDYTGSKYSDIKWLVEGVETNLVTDKGDGVWSYIIQGTGHLSVELRNDANKDNEDNPTWATSKKLSFTMKEEPAVPYISIDPASGIICEGSEATIKVENPSKACSYKLVEEEDTKAGFKKYESGDLKYSVGSVGKYYVAAKHIECSTNEYTSNQVAINQIIRTSAKISIEPANAETTPWEPVSITVTADEGYVYEVTYTGNNLQDVEGVIIKQNGDSYTYYIPRPDSWGTGNATSARETVNYGIEAQLKVDGEESTCKLKAATAIIQLKDEDNENCPK